MSDGREWHPNFLNYTNFIINHGNYKGLYYERKSDGRVEWVVVGKSKKGQLRRKWWGEKCRENGIKIQAGCYAKIARIIHPTKKHVCQICGREMSVFYVYPTKNLLVKLNNICEQLDLVPFEYTNETIFEIFNTLLDGEDPPFAEIREIFKIPASVKEDKKEFIDFVDKNYVEKESRLLSPGVMSNSPDRFDGFHSDGLCCRSKSDKGRHKLNLMRYGEDRRAYESWSSGVWKLASWLMREYSKRDIICLSCKKETKCSADHIGPISCGFAHSSFFNPLCPECNSSKNKRMNLNDVEQLLEIEKTTPVISWHSKYIWDRVKHDIHTDKDAVKVSNLMRENLHHILILLSILSDNGFKQYLLRYLNPKYAFFQYGFEVDNLIGLIGPDKIKVWAVNRTEHRRNAIRGIRISFESLENYRAKVNRRLRFPALTSDQFIETKIAEIIEDLSNIYTERIYSIPAIIKSIEDNVLYQSNREAVLAYFDKFKISTPQLIKVNTKLNTIIQEIGDFLIQNWDS